MTEQHKDPTAPVVFEDVTPEMVDAYLMEARRLRAAAVSEAMQSIGRALFAKSETRQSQPSAPVATRPIGAAG